MKIEKLSKMALWISAGLAIIIFVLNFALGDSDEYIGDNAVPVMTDAVLFLMYLMVVVTIGLTAWSIFTSVKCNSGTDSTKTTGVPGGKIIACVLALFVGSLVIGFIAGIGAEPFTATDGTETSAGWVQVVDMFCWSIIILTVAACAAVGVSMSGVLTKTASK